MHTYPIIVKLADGTEIMYTQFTGIDDAYQYALDNGLGAVDAWDASEQVEQEAAEKTAKIRKERIKGALHAIASWSRTESRQAKNGLITNSKLNSVCMAMTIGGHKTLAQYV